MDDKQTSSSWDDLIKQIGAAPPPDALERKRPAIETQFEPPAAPPPKPKPGDWNALADKLGVEVPAEPEPPRAKSSREAAAEAPGPSSEALEVSLSAIEPMESDFEEIVEAEIADIDFEFEEDDSDLVEEGAEGADTQTLSGEAARNAFEALFDAGSFVAMPPEERAARPLEGPRAPKRRERDEPRDDAFDEVEMEAAGERDVEAREEGEGASSEERGRPRRRGRRRRGRGRGERTEEAGAPRETAGEREEADQWAEPITGGEEGAEAAEGEPGEKPRRRRVRRRRPGVSGGETAAERPAPGAHDGRPAPSRISDEEDEEEAEEEVSVVSAAHNGEEEEDEEDELARASHKNIPTWSEAIAVMVETNMQSRKNAPQRPSASRERGRGRGRGRGGRRGKP